MARSPVAARKAIPRLPQGDGLLRHGIRHPGQVFWNLQTPALYEEALKRREGRLAQGGAFVVRTGAHTGRSPNDKFIVEEPSSAERIWCGKVNRPFEARKFDALHRRVLAYLEGKDLFVQDSFVGADAAYRRSIRVITETAWHSLFARTMFLTAADGGAAFQPEFLLLHAPNFQA